MGNVEGRELFLNHCDVVVCDGFVGNVVLKVTEGTSSLLFKMIKEQFKSDFIGMLIGMLAKPFMKRIYERINYEEFGGCLLLGVKRDYGNLSWKKQGICNQKCCKGCKRSSCYRCKQ